MSHCPPVPSGSPSAAPGTARSPGRSARARRAGHRSSSSACPTRRWPSMRIASSCSASPRARIRSPRRPHSSSCARNMYRLASPRRTENCRPDVGAALEQLEGAGEGGLDLRREPLRRHQGPRERRPERDLLVDTVGRGGRGVQDGEHVRRQARGIEIPAVRVVEREERLREPVQVFEVARLDPVAPRDPQVPDVRVEGLQGDLAPGAGQLTRAGGGPRPRSTRRGPGGLARRRRAAGRGGRWRTRGSS